MNVDIPWKNVEDLGNWHFQNSGLTYDDVLNSPSQMVSFGIRYRKYEEEGFKFNTPSGKIELYSNVLKNHGQDPLPSFKEPTESPYSTPELLKDYPFISINHRHRVYTHTEFRQAPSLRKLYPDFLIEINPETAAEFGITDGDEMYIERHGFEDKVYGKAKLIPELHPKVVSCLCLWWYPEETGPEYGCFKSNINSIISTKPPYDPIGGTPNLRAILCRIGKSTSRATK